MMLIKKIADNNNPASLSHKLRTKRFQFFLSLINHLPRPLSILDIGGTTAFWEAMNFNNEGVTITLLNLSAQPLYRKGFISVSGDATRLQYPDQSFDVVFSNSVIEHLFDQESQQKMAAEIQRVGKCYFIQTPNYWFPIEPHWVFPFFQYLPFPTRVFLTQHLSLGHIKKIRTKVDAEKQVREIKLLSYKQMQSLFPEASIHCEKFFFLTKSFVAYKF